MNNMAGKIFVKVVATILILLMVLTVGYTLMYYLVPILRTLF